MYSDGIGVCNRASGGCNQWSFGLTARARSSAANQVETYMRNRNVGLLAVVLLSSICFIIPRFLSRFGIPARGKMKLADLKAHGQNGFSFKCPANARIWFVLGTTNHQRNVFKGTIAIKGANEPACDQSFSSNNLRRCRWLAGDKLYGFAICCPDKSGSLESWPLKEGGAYSGTISINAEGDGEVSLWLYWFGKDTGK
jgi:hypothetical protein